MKVLLPQASNISILDYVDDARNGKDALEKVIASHRQGKFCYGLIFMDCNMPIMDGFEATDAIRSFISGTDVQQPIIIASTGHFDEEYMKKIWSHRMDEFLMKPTSIEVLKRILGECIEFVPNYN